MDIQLIATDLDGTALINHHEISPRLARVLETAHARGIHIVPVTGRQYRMLPPFLPASWSRYAVLCNGSELRTLPDGTVLSSHYLTEELLTGHLPALLDLGLTVELSGGGRLHATAPMLEEILASPVNPFHRVVLGERGLAVKDLMDFSHNLPYPIDKINLPYVPPEKREALMALLPSLPFSGVWSGPNSMEVTHAEATKGKGLLALCDRLGVDPRATMALGDSGNDVPMLAVAGLSVAMGNAPDFVKAAARTVTLSNVEDGAAAAIEKYALGQ